MGADRFCFFVSGEEKQIFPDSGLWQYPLSGKDPGSSSTSFPRETSPTEHHAGADGLTIGDYFTACSHYLLQEDYAVLRAGMQTILNRPVSSDEIASIHVYLEKHGAFYHPLKVSVTIQDNCSADFVLNGAVSESGLSLIESECSLISNLRKTLKYTGTGSGLPRIFGHGMVDTEKSPVGFFFGEWFNGFKEFHITCRHGKEKIVIWNSDGSCRYLSISQALPIYEEIARMLTGFYNFQTGAQIFPWHHAAGDFIVKYEPGQVQVRLITVRGYHPLIEFDPDMKKQGAHVLPSLLIFFVHLTVRMRIDRIDGTKALVFLDDQVAAASVNGFLKGLDEKKDRFGHDDILSSFKGFFQQFDADQVCGIIENILDSYSPQSPEIELIQKNMDRHSKLLVSIFKTI